jgi:DNA-binding transcriptional LysR family regulator
MERLKRVASVWSWLPAFRAVAETQHLPTASAELEVSASALSRTIRLLENDIGRTLFERQGRRIVLNEAGERLLVAVRDAMRRVHDGMSLMDSTELEGPLFVASSGGVADLVVTGAMARLHETSPGVVPHLRSVDEGRFTASLLQGDLDVAFTTAPLDDGNLTRAQLGTIDSAVYGPPDHPATRSRKVAPGEYPFVLWGRRPDGTTRDGWPNAAPRQTAAVVGSFHDAHAVARRIGALVVLPEVFGRTLVERGEVVVIRSKVQPIPVFALHRHSLLPGGRAETLVSLATSAIASGLE